MDENAGGGAHDEIEPPICGCGVTAIPAESASWGRPAFVCENPDCEAFGEEIG